MAKNRTICRSLAVSICMSLSVFSVANAKIGEVEGNIENDNLVFSNSSANRNFAESEIYNDSNYAPIQAQLPKPTHYYATTPSCTTRDLEVDCNLRRCTYNNTNGVQLQILTKPIDQETPPDGIGTEVDPNDDEILNQWDRGGTFCTASLPAAKGAVLSEALDFQTEDLQEHGLIAAKVNGPKNNGLTLIKYNTNIWAEPQDQTINTTVLDVPVQARATPKEYVFDYGDGTPLQTRSVPGHFLRDDQWDVKTATTHVYEETGTFQANVMTVYEAEFSVNGGEWLPMTGQAEVWGNPVPVDVWRTDTYLVDGKKATSNK